MIDDDEHTGYFTGEANTFAVYSADDNSLRFYTRNYTPAVGEKINGLTVTAIDTSIESLSDMISTSSVSTTALDESTIFDISDDENIDNSDTSDDTTTATVPDISEKIVLNNSSTNNTNANNTSGGMSGAYTSTNTSTTTSNIDSLKTSSTPPMSSITNTENKLVITNSENNDQNVTNNTVNTFSLCDTLIDNATDVTDMVTTFAGESSSTTTLIPATSIKTIVCEDSLTFPGTSLASYFATTSSTGYINVTSIDLHKMNVSNVTSFYRMFYANSTSNTKLTSLNINGWDVSAGTNFSYMFYDQNKLTELNLSAWAMKAATNLSYMFAYCSGLTSINLSGWDISTVTNMNYMLRSCSSLTSIDLSSFTVPSSATVNYMMYGCNKAEQITLNSSWHFTTYTMPDPLGYTATGYYWYNKDSQKLTRSQFPSSWSSSWQQVWYVDSCKANQHTYGNQKYTWASDKSYCTGYATCTKCGVDYVSSSGVRSNASTNAVTTAATCAATGVRTYYASWSSSYNSIFSQQTTTTSIAKTSDHSYGNQKYSWASDYSYCTGYASCTRCGTAYVSSSGVKSNNSTNSVTKAATCTATGTKTYYASWSSQYSSIFTKQTKAVSTSMLAHSYKSTGDPSWTVSSDKVTASTMTFKCSSCSKTTTETANTTNKQLSTDGKNYIPANDTSFTYSYWTAKFYTSGSTITKYKKVKNGKAIYRYYYNSGTGANADGMHLWTTDKNEAKGLANWSFEGVAWYAPLYGTTTVHRYRSSSNGGDYALATSQPSGYTQESVSFYSGGGKVIYKGYHQGVGSTKTMYTADTNEITSIGKGKSFISTPWDSTLRCLVTVKSSDNW
jgi:surface protein